MLPPDWNGSPLCEIRGERAHYLSRVLRLATGDSILAMDSGAEQHDCIIIEMEAGRVLLSVRATSPAGAAGSARAACAQTKIILVQALPKAGKMDLIVRQAAETGVSLVIPLLSRHCVSRPEAGRDRAARRERWERVAREALQQSGSDIVTRVGDIVELPSLPGHLDALAPPSRSRLRLLLHEAPLDAASLHGYLDLLPDTVILCIGPEGGFSPEETSFLVAGGFCILHFRAAVLRTETAALYAVAAVQTIISERSAWNPA
jgi:16S rRNA (uracil1498-N3)-methyltransferase